MDFQDAVDEWMLKCFGKTIARDTLERNHRFLEEALELVQSKGCTKDEAHQLVDYVFSRPVGDPEEEIGDTLLSLAALCTASKFSMEKCAIQGLLKATKKTEQIREKRANKPDFSPLPE